jgi:protein tyrosine/serine phosphatase
MAETQVKNPRRFWTTVGVIAIVVVGAFGVWWTFIDDYHYAVVQPGVLYRDGNRSIREFKTAHRRSDFKTVVCLVSDREFEREEFREEAKFCREKGIELIRVPIKEGGSPTDAEVERFLGIATDPKKQPVLVHCAQGVMRTGMMVAAYQQRVLGYDRQKTLDSIRNFGKGIERIEGVKAFIETQYAPAPATRSTSEASTAGAVRE